MAAAANLQTPTAVRVRKRQHGGWVLTDGGGKRKLTAAVYRTEREADGARLRLQRLLRAKAPEGTTA